MTPFHTAAPEVISLIRFSTAGQVTDDKAGVEGQRQVNATTAARLNLKIRREVVLVDVSGRHVMQDAKFVGMCDELKADANLSGVLTAEQSRMFRPDKENYEAYAILSMLAKYKKLLYTPDGITDMNTSQGRMSAHFKAIMNGEEIEIIKERFQRGKASDRLARKHPGGNQMLPKTVRYVREYATNPNGKQVVTATRWVLDVLWSERMKLAFRLLFEGDSYEVIAEKIGGGLQGSSLRRLMMNPIHIGIRRYALEAKGEEYPPKARPETYLKHEPGWEPKMRRKLTKKDAVLDVPSREQLERGAPPIVEPILTLDEWDRAQAIITSRTSRWSKSKLKHTNRERFLAHGIGYCSCGQPLYGRYGSRGSHLDSYYCRTRFPKGAGCGMHSIHRADVDPAIEATVTRLADADFVLRALRSALALAAPQPVNPATAARERSLAKLRVGRNNLVGALGDGEIDRESFRKKMACVEADIRALEAQVPAPQPEVDHQQIADLIVRAFQEFGLLTFAQKRSVLRGAVKSIIVDSHARAITTVTISGGYLGIGANSVLRSTRQPQISASIGDLTLRLVEPVQIPDTYVDGRKANGRHPRTRATQFPRRAA